MARYSDELIEEIISKNDIVDVVSQYVTLKRSGKYLFGLCPFHKEKSPSFSVSPNKGIFYCFGCGVGGNSIHFISKIENLSYKESMEMLAEKSGIALPTIEGGEDSKLLKLKSRVYEINQLTALFYHENLYKPLAKPAQEYVKKRKLDNNTLKNFLIGYSGTYNELYLMLKEKGFTEEEILSSSLVNKTPEGKFVDRFRKRLMFPIQDTRNRVIAFGGRVLDDSKPKYINSPENIVYSKGRNLFGLNVAKKSDLTKIIIVEGYMDAISLHQRGITNAVASLGTAMTEAQGRLLRKSSQQVIIGYDSDGAGQAATMRGLEILHSMGCDLRILQLEGAKDPDEFVIKYGPERFQKQVEKSISLVEYKVKVLRNTLNIEHPNDKIKFLKEIAKVLSKIDNEIEREVYIEKIASEYQISKEAIYAEINKLEYASSTGNKILQKAKPKLEVKEQNVLDSQNDKREKMLIYLLINYPEESYLKIRQKVEIEDIKNERNKSIVKKLYEELEKGNSNTNNVLDWFEEEQTINEISWILAYDFEITEVNKCIEDILKLYSKEKIIAERNQIIKQLERTDLDEGQKRELETKLSNIIIQLAKMK